MGTAESSFVEFITNIIATVRTHKSCFMAIWLINKPLLHVILMKYEHPKLKQSLREVPKCIKQKTIKGIKSFERALLQVRQSVHFVVCYM
jgi:hypothetical protein